MIVKLNYDDEMMETFKTLSSAESDPEMSVELLKLAHAVSLEKAKELVLPLGGKFKVSNSYSPEYVIINVGTSDPKLVDNYRLRLMQSGMVKSVEVDPIVTTNMQPNDPNFSMQKNIVSTINPVLGSSHVERAWDITMGNPTSVIAILDSGIAWNYKDLDTSRILPGYDFVIQNEPGDEPGPDNNPTTPPGTNPARYHGSHVAAELITKTNNGYGLAGIDNYAKILPVRVLPNEGEAYMSAVNIGIIWASGGYLGWAPTNKNKASIISLSLGAYGVVDCPSSLQSAINQARSRGTKIITSAGNSNGQTRHQAPANCLGVIAVSAVDDTGNRAFYSNYDNTEYSDPGELGTDIFAHGDLVSRDIASDPINQPLKTIKGTSFSAPLVAGIFSLAQQIRPDITEQQFIDAVNATGKPVYGCRVNTTQSASVCKEKNIDAYALLNYLRK